MLWWLRLTGAVLLLGLGLVAVFRVPHGVLWKPAVGATAFGVWLIPLAALVTWTAPELDAPFLMAVVAAILLASPILRSLPRSPMVRDTMNEAFGSNSWRSPHASARAAPLTLPGLFGPRLPKRTPTSHVFDSQHRLALDFYRGSGAGPHPLVIAVHGGSWNSGDASQLTGVNRYLAARGISVAAVTYRLAPRHIFPAQQEDIASAVRWLKKNADNLNLDPDRIVLLGRSAGGQLALLSAYTLADPSIRGVVGLYAPTDMNWGWDNPCNPRVMDSVATLREYLGGSQEEMPQTFDAASPIRFVDPSDPPTLLIHGTRDELVYAEQSRRLARRLADASVPHALVELPWDTHGLDANLGGPGGQLYLWSLERFLGFAFRDNDTAA